MLLILCFCLVHTATSSTAAQSYLRNPTDGPSSEGEGRSYNASELEYRPGRSGDVMFGKPIRRIWKYQRFVAVDPKAPHGRDVVGYVESTADYPLPLCVKSALSDKEMRSILVYLLRVKVREDWQNKKVGSTMLPGALEDVSMGHGNVIRRTWPSAVGVHLLVVDDNHFAIKLYEKLNFTDVGGENGSALLGTAHGGVLVPVSLYLM
ncbi:hypothetical protein FOZ62_018902 [Perkinsus olseni]|uniref:N-acetyltransferase domain-containing protein n=1 Tax=Perkinsus olseni TaxID=32597 RepID=A0A7J6QT14_PEROL|nr:hypothetical protein FOZ62_018902 [Perkinsus olseni]